MIIISAYLDFADQAARDKAVAESTPIQMATRNDEPGCHAYCFAADPGVPNRIQVYELWEDEPTLAAHFTHQNYEDMKTVLGAAGITATENQMYQISANEPVYDANGQPRTKFFVGQG